MEREPEHRERPALGPLFDRILEATTNPAREWRGEIALTLAGQQRLLLVRTARLGESADHFVPADEVRRAWQEAL